MINEIIAELRERFSNLDLGEEVSAREAVREEQRTVREAFDRAGKEHDALQQQVRDLQSLPRGADTEAAADAYLRGDGDDEIVTEARLRDQMECLAKVRVGLNRKMEALSLQERQATDVLHDKLRTAFPADAVNEAVATITGALAELQGIVRTLGAATRGGEYLTMYLDEILRSAVGNRLPVALPHKPAEALIEALEEHRATIEQGRGRILEWLIVPRVDPEPESEPAPEEKPYVPGIGGSTGFPPGSIATTLLP